MALSKILLFSFLTIFTACSGQEKTNTFKVPNTIKPSPRVIKNFKSVALAPDFDTTLVSQYIRSIFQDSKGNLWFGTLGEGVVRYNAGLPSDGYRSADRQDLDGQVKTLTYFSNPDGFISSSVFAINEDKMGNLWFGTDQGVYKYDASNDAGKTLPIGALAKSRFRNYNQKDGLSHIEISRKSILVDRSGSVWVGTHGGVFRYDPIVDNMGGQSFSLFKLLPPINVAGIMEDKDGNIWFASSDKGVFRYDPSASLKSGRKTLPTGQAGITNISEKAGLGENYAGGIAQDKAGNMWFTMKNGICKYDASGDAGTGLPAGALAQAGFTEYTAKDGLGGTEFWGIYIEESGIIWVTARGSTTRFDPSIPLPNPKAFTVFTPVDGLNCCVQSMYQDKSGNMWWGAGSGLFRYDASVPEGQGNRFYKVKRNGPW